jgi:tRNA pseudouridine38-40 synthase
LLPTYLLQDKETILTALQAAFEQQGPLIDVARSGGYADAGSDRFLGPNVLGAVRQKLLTFRIDSERLDVVRKALRCFEGTKPYHNFTTGKTPTDANAKRYITSFLCSDPFIDPLSQTEWLIFSIEGQSFLLNQIRKMVGMIVEVASGKTSLQVAEASLTAVKVEIPMAPGLGLYLDELYFKAYNVKQNRHIATRMAPRGSTHESISSSSSSSSSADIGGDEGGEKLDWTETSSVKTTMTTFKQDVIWPHIMQEERENLHFLYYMDNLRVHPYHFNIKEFKSNDIHKKEETIGGDVK